MELPKNGSIVIVDDQITEALPLMNALAKRGVSYSYYDGKGNSYPAKPLDSVRLIFLDMHLDEATGGATSTKNIVSLLVAGIGALVAENNGPYAVMVWSKHDSQHLAELKDTLLNQDSVPCKPIAVLNMEKSMCFESQNVCMDGKDTSVIWVLKDGGLEIIEQNLKKQLETVDAFLLMCNWENGVRTSARETIRTVASIFDNDSQKWNENLKACMVRMAKAYAGHTLEVSDANVIRNAYYSMNSIVNDVNGVQVECEVDSVSKDIAVLQKRDGVRGHIIVSEFFDGKEYILAHEEKTFRLYEEQKVICESGQINSIFTSKKDEYDNIKEKLYEMYWDSVSSINSSLNIRSYILDLNRPGNIYKASDGMKKELCEEYNLDYSSSEIVAIELEISPLCDYAQKKRMRFRLLPGLQIPCTVKVKEGNKYTTVTVPMMLNGKRARFLFDFRYFTSENMDYLNGKEPLYAIGDELLQTIKDELSAHGVRSGIISV